ncbi:hypoxanthine phosphoribosyltransferase [soil metagenome]
MSKKTILFEEKIIDAREVELAQEIKMTYFPRGVPKELNLILLGVLKGAAAFATNLHRELFRLGLDIPIEFLPASSYGNGKVSSGELQFSFDDTLKKRLTGKDILLVEDIIDTGVTLSQLTEYIQRVIEPSSLRIVVEFDKPSKRTHPVKIDFIGFEIPGAWVEGRGIDTAGYGRGNPNLVSID